MRLVIRYYMVLPVAIIFLVTNLHCGSGQESPEKLQDAGQVVEEVTLKEEDRSSPENQLPVREKKRLPFQEKITFPWLTAFDKEAILMAQIPPPDGAIRQELPPESFATWLRHLPLYPASRKVLLFDGKEKGNQAAHHRVINIDVGNRDLQQCADAVMRLKAEYHFYKKEYDKIHFNYTSGDKVAFDDWSKGRKPVVSGNKVTFTQKGAATNNSYTNFKKYMQAVFNYAGTASLEKELLPVALTDMQVGDVFIQGGFPGHAILVVDMAEAQTPDNPKGKKYFLLAQSYMPAQEIHVLNNPATDSPWYALDFGDELRTPEWGFSKDDLMRFRE